MKTEWSGPAWLTACAAASASQESRRRWAGQNAWDAENMETVSTRMPKEDAAQLRQYCQDAGINRYTLLNYMLRTWMAAWAADHERGNET